MTATLVNCPTFVDLRSFADGAQPAADPFGAGRILLPLGEAPVEIGAIALEAGSGTTTPLGGDWWLIAEQGAVTLAAGGQEIILSGKQSCVVSDGTALSWQTEIGCRLIFMRYTRGAGAEQGIVPIDLGAELAPSGAPRAELLTTPTPACRNHTDFRSADGEFTCGVWDSSPYTRTAMCYVHFELMVLLKGAVTFVDEAGREGTFRQGDIFLVEQGASCSWESLEDVAKIYAIFRPLA